MPLWPLALLVGALPFFTIHTTYLVSAAEGHIAWCIPYWDACTSISRTGRHGTSYFLFKAGMLPAALLGILFWLLNARWLHQLGAPGRTALTLPWIGAVAGICLIAYTVTLGHPGETPGLIRRTGVILYFSLTFIAQSLLGSALLGTRLHGPARWLTGLSLLTLATGILSVILSAVAYHYYTEIDDAFEWTLALLINLHVFATAVLWRKSCFCVWI